MMNLGLRAGLGALLLVGSLLGAQSGSSATTLEARAGQGRFESLNAAGFDAMSVAVGPDSSVFRAGSSLNPDGSFGGLVVQRLGPAGWVTLGEVDPRQHTADGQLLAGSSLFWAHRDTIGSGPDLASSVNVQRWNGQAWVKLGASLCRDEFSACGFPPQTIAETGFRAVLDAQGQPVVAFSERLSTSHSSPFAVFLKRWTGRTWQPLGQVSLPSASLVPLELTSTRTGLHLAALAHPSGVIHLRSFTGRGWTTEKPIPGLRDANRVALAFDARGSAIVARQVANELIVQRWNGQTLERTGPERQPGAGFALAARPGGRPVLAWVNGPLLTAARWNGRAWDMLGTFHKGSSQDRFELRGLALDAQDNPLVALRSLRLEGSRVDFTGFYLERFRP